MDKTERLLRMMEHPEKYSEEEWQEMLADEDCRELYEAMRLGADAFEMEDAQRKLNDGLREEEWQKFEARHYATKQHTRGWLQIAATIVGILMLSGITYAAIHLWKTSSSLSTKGDKSEYAQVTDTTSQTAPLTVGKELGNDTIIFEDAELGTILREVATFYQCETVYKKEKVKHVRLYFTWDKTSEIDDVIETFNKFERIRITRENQRLIVE